MKIILNIIILLKVIRKKKMGGKLVFKKYDEGSITFMVDKEPVTLMFNNIVSLVSDGNYTDYNLKKGKTVSRLLGIGLCCLELSREHYGCYSNSEVVNFHFCLDYSRGKKCIIKLSGDRNSTVSRYEKVRYKEDIRLFNLRETARKIRDILKKKKGL